MAASMFTAAAPAQPVHLDLKSLFDTDTVLEPGGAPLTAPLQAERDRIDGGTLPASYQANAPFVSGSSSFLFAPLKQSSLDAAVLNGQTLPVPSGRYAALDLALLAAPDSYANPFTHLQLRYTDGSSEDKQFGPIPGWFASPTAFDHAFFSYLDNSGVASLVSFSTDWGDEESAYLLESRGNGNANGVRFVDGNGYALFLIPLSIDLTNATLGITVGNNFVISLASTYADPSFSPIEGYTEVANSMTLHDGFEHRALGNLKLYEFDLKPFLADRTGELYVLFTDATPNNGWGPYIQNISVYTGANRLYENTFMPAWNTNQATVYAQFLADGGPAEKPYLFDNSGYGPSNRRHRFADAAGSITYKFDLPDSVTEASLVVDMANNFVVSLSGPIDLQRYAQAAPGAIDEEDFLVDDGNSTLGGHFRFADRSAYMVYQFDLPDAVSTAVAQISVGNQFVIELAAGADGEFVKERDYVEETGEEIRDNTNFKIYNIQLDNYLRNNPEKIVRIRLSDGAPADGWGPYLTGITIANRADTSQNSYQTALNSMELFGVDVRSELNKAYYTIDLASVLRANNPQKEVYVKFTDGSTADGWGPGIFWMAIYSGTLTIQSDRTIFPGLKAMNGDPEGFGVNLLHRRYPVDSARTLKEIGFPSQPEIESNKAYLLAATLIPAATGVKLSAQRASPNTIQLSWPASAAGYILQTALQPAGPWSDVTETPASQDDQMILSVAVTAGPHFYRLKR